MDERVPLLLIKVCSESIGNESGTNAEDEGDGGR